MVHCRRFLSRSEALWRRAVTGDRRIDQLVYELSGLTDEEIGIVEEATQ